MQFLMCIFTLATTAGYCDGPIGKQEAVILYQDVQTYQNVLENTHSFLAFDKLSEMQSLFEKEVELSVCSDKVKAEVLVGFYGYTCDFLACMRQQKVDEAAYCRIMDDQAFKSLKGSDLTSYKEIMEYRNEKNAELKARLDSVYSEFCAKLKREQKHLTTLGGTNA